MKSISLEPVFMPVTTDIAPLRGKLKRNRAMADVLRSLEEADFNVTYDLLRNRAMELAAKEDVEKAIDTLGEINSAIAGDDLPDEGRRLDLHAALMQILTSLHIEMGALDEAAASAASTLNLLAQEPKRKDEPFLQILGAQLYDIAFLHSSRGEYKQAEREIEKSVKIFERLARIDAARYAPPHVMALNGATVIYRNRVKQAELLAHYQASTSAYLQMLNSGVDDAASRLVESLAAEGDTLVQMGRHREAVQYYTRALKYLTRLENEFTLRQLQLSIALGESMLRISAMRDKGVHLLNTMLHKATKLNAETEHRRIVDALVNAKSRSLDILSIWHKIFPK